ncbi:MAG TPA: hypothetical protein VG321_04250 [Solirubrobacteraceae bacterium]|nr:hypothetical protein [Solirubrobacteraceae bacterium]
MVAIAVIIAAFLAWLVVRRQYRRRLPARSIIVTPRKSTLIARDGSVRSVQSARLTLSQADLDDLWSPANLENLGRTYWRFLTRVTLGLIRVRYSENDRSVILLARPLTLLRFDAPEYVLEPDHGRVTWRIRDGLLVARSGRGSGWLSLDVCRMPAPPDPKAPVELSIEVEVANFYPAIAVGISTPTYEATQAFVHVLVTHAFLRSLATLELHESKVRHFQVEEAADTDGSAQTSAQSVKTPSTPSA